MPQKTKQEKILAMQAQADPDGVIPEAAIPDCKVGVRTDRYHRISKSGHHYRGSIASLYQHDRDVLAMQHGPEANRDWADELRRRREEELAERHARWEAAQVEAK